MPSRRIKFIEEDVEIGFLKRKGDIKSWIERVILDHKAKPVEINYIFCSDEYLLKVNKEYLNHDYYTDIITFDNSELEGEIESDIFISLDRVKENAENLKEPFLKELHRVIIHGILHLLGYKDKTKKDQEVMRKKEDEYLLLYGL